MKKSDTILFVGYTLLPFSHCFLYLFFVTKTFSRVCLKGEGIHDIQATKQKDPIIIAFTWNT